MRPGEVGCAIGGDKDIVALLSHAQLFCLAFDAELNQLIESDDATLSLGVHHDSIPQKAFFGQLAYIVAPLARYFHFNDESKEWDLLPYDRYIHAVGKSLPRAGVVELFTLNAKVTYRMSNGTTGRHKIILKPRVLPHTKASAIFSGVKQCLPQLCDIDNTKALCERLRYMFRWEVPDAGSGPVRSVWGTLKRLNDVANCFYVVHTCIGHGFHRIIVHLGQEGLLMGDLYTCKFISLLAPYYHRLWMVFRALVWEELWIRRRREVSDTEYESWQAHTRDVLGHTLMRKDEHTRGRLDDIGSALKPAMGSKYHQDRLESILAVHTGDTRMPRFNVVVPDDCTKSDDEIKEAFAQSLLQAEVLLEGGAQLPSKNKWKSATSASSQVTGATMLYNIWPRIFKRAFPNWRAGEEVAEELDNDDDDFKNNCAAKVHRLRCIITTETHRLLEMQLTTFTCEPLDWCYNKKQQ